MKKLLIIVLLFISGLQFASAQSESAAEPISQTQTEKVKVFPNPATNVVNILGLKNSVKADIHIMDTYGNLVLQHRWAIKNKALNIPITSLNPGIYIVTIHSEEQQVQTKFYKK